MSECMIVACSAQVNHYKSVHGLLAGRTTYAKACDLCLLFVNIQRAIIDCAIEARMTAVFGPTSCKLQHLC